MKRREFFAAAGLGASAVLAGKTRTIQAAEPEVEKRLQIYYCEECGTIVEILEPGEATLVHCKVPMKLLEELTEGTGAEKHVPVIEKVDGGYKVKVGEVTHPMLDAHSIRWIGLIADGRLYRQFLKPGSAPEAVFPLAAKNVAARAYCNLHGLWRNV